MVDNTDEEHLDNPTDNQSEIPPDEITPTAQNQETENMEVHHHAHDPAAPHHKKNWKSYFWEFLMLFLAVFCGFLAEYQLEHKIERDRGKQYTYSFYEDLLTDSTHFNDLITRFQKKLTVLQDMAPCYDSLLSDHPPKNCLTAIMRSAFDFPDLVNTDRTLQQLKNAGGLRLLKKADADSILLYDNILRSYKSAETSGFQEVQSDIRNTFYSLVNFESWKGKALNSTVFTIYGNNKELLNRYFNQLRMYTEWIRVRMKQLQNLKKRNVELIAYFKAKYQY